MATCSKCQKEIGIFGRVYTCLYCGKTLCKQCRKPLELPEGIGYTFELLDLPHANIICDSVPIIKTRKDVSCKECYPKFINAINIVRKVKNSNKKIELLPNTYKGKRNTIGSGIRIISEWHEDWSECDDDLRLLAIYNNCDCVLEIEKERDTETYEETKDNGKGTYTKSYTIWRKSGIAYPLKK